MTLQIKARKTILGESRVFLGGGFLYGDDSKPSLDTRLVAVNQSLCCGFKNTVKSQTLPSSTPSLVNPFPRQPLFLHIANNIGRSHYQFLGACLLPVTEPGVQAALLRNMMCFPLRRNKSEASTRRLIGPVIDQHTATGYRDVESVAAGLYGVDA